MREERGKKLKKKRLNSSVEYWRIISVRNCYRIVGPRIGTFFLYYRLLKLHVSGGVQSGIPEQEEMRYNVSASK